MKTAILILVLTLGACANTATEHTSEAIGAASCSQTFCNPYECTDDNCFENQTADLLCTLASCDGSTDSVCNQQFFEADWSSCERRCDRASDFVACHNSCMIGIRRTCLGAE